MTNGIPDSILELNEDQQDAVRDDAWNAAHRGCEHCSKPVCIHNDDGTSDCSACANEMGEFLHDADGTETGVLHDDCRVEYTMLALRDAIARFLDVRRGVELNSLTIAERANNGAIRLLEEFNITIKEAKRP